MELLIFTLLAVHCSSVVSNSLQPSGRQRLEEILIYIENVKGSLKNSEHLVNTPPENTEDDCCLTALECYRSNLRQHFNLTQEKPVRKLFRGLKSPITDETMHFCNSNNTTATCQDKCEKHPQKSATEFLERLVSLINRAISNLTPVN